ncbi:uncharacterized protein V6R79_006862 [Siganus canaliculatus]
MKLYSVLVLMVTLSAAYGLRCYVCGGSADACKEPAAVDCPAGTDTCVSAKKDGLVAKSCFNKAACTKEVSCCDKDLCNGAITTGQSGPSGDGAITTGSSVLLLLLSSAIITTFL